MAAHDRIYDGKDVDGTEGFYLPAAFCAMPDCMNLVPDDPAAEGWKRAAGLWRWVCPSCNN